MSNAIDHLINGDLELFKKSINNELYSKVATAFEERKKEIASDYLSDGCSSCGGQINEARPGTNRAAITGAAALKKKVGTEPNPNNVRMVKNPKWKRPGEGNQPQNIPADEGKE